MVCSAIDRNFWAMNAATTFGILTDFLNRSREKSCVPFQDFRPEIRLCPCKDARNVVSRFRCDNDVHTYLPFCEARLPTSVLMSEMKS